MTGAQMGLWQVAAVWAVGVAVAIYATSHISGAHLNPAVSLAFAIFRGREFPARRLPAYWSAQLAGAALAGLAVLVVFGSSISRFEESRGIVRGEAGSQLSAMAFGEYFPNPDIVGVDQDARRLISSGGAVLVEAFGTGILVLVIFALTERRRAVVPAGNLTPVLVGLTVAALISLFAPLTQGGWNPARDFGPRVVAWLAGWDSIAIPGPSSGFWVYIVGPLVGGPLGAAVHELLLRPPRVANTVEQDE